MSQPGDRCLREPEVFPCLCTARAVMSGVRIATSIVRVQPVYLDEGEPGLKDQAETGVMGPVGEDVSEQCVQPRPWKWKRDGHS